jgi:hypothetical protein
MSASSAAVHIAADSVVLDGLLEAPLEARGLMLFAHGSGRSRLSPRNNHIARARPLSLALRRSVNLSQ